MAANATVATVTLTDSNAPQLQRVMTAMITVPFIFMALRFYCKWGTNRRFGWDDGALLLSWLLHVAYCGVTMAGTAFGLGRHIDTISPGDLITSLKLLYIGNWFVIWAISLSKTSFALTLLSLVTKRWQVWFLWFTIVSLNIIMGLDAIFQFTQCTPVDKTWDLSLQGSCWDTHIVIYYSMFAGAWSAFLDFVLAGVPWLLFWDVKMMGPEKIGLIVAMSLGVFSGITACVKTAYLPELGRWTDLTFSTPELLMWAAAETAITITAASIPFLRKLVWRVFRRARSQTSHTNTNAGKTEQRATKGETAVHLSSMAAKSKAYAIQVRKINDDESEKSILGEGNGAGNGILVSQQFTVHVDSDDAKVPSAGSEQW